MVRLGVQAIIEGYKSYKDQTISEPFDQHINVVGMLMVQCMARRCLDLPCNRGNSGPTTPATIT